MSYEEADFPHVTWLTNSLTNLPIYLLFFFSILPVAEWETALFPFSLSPAPISCTSEPPLLSIPCLLPSSVIHDPQPMFLQLFSTVLLVFSVQVSSSPQLSLHYIFCYQSHLLHPDQMLSFFYNPWMTSWPLNIKKLFFFSLLFLIFQFK